MAQVETDKLVDRERLKMAVSALRDASEHGLTRAKLAEVMGGVGLRSADRARQLLLAQGARFDIKSDPRTRERIFIMIKGPRWDETISRETRLALRVAAMTLGLGGNATLQKQLETLVEITEKNLTDKDRKFLERLRRNIRVTGGVAEDPADGQVAALEAAFNAFSTEIPRQMELDYRRPGTTSPRRIVFSPYCFTQDLISGGTFLLGEDAERHKVMQLRLSRIQNAKVLNRPVIFLRETQLKIAAEHQIGGWTSPSDPFEVRLRVTGANWIQAMEEAKPAFPGFQMEQRGSSALVRFQANAPEGLIRWILQLGPSAEVLAPEFLREKVKEAVEDMAKAYR